VQKIIYTYKKIFTNLQQNPEDESIRFWRRLITKNLRRARPLRWPTTRSSDPEVGQSRRWLIPGTADPEDQLIRSRRASGNSCRWVEHTGHPWAVSLSRDHWLTAGRGAEREYYGTSDAARTAFNADPPRIWHFKSMLIRIRIQGFKATVRPNGICMSVVSLDRP
jgi:hypothetical protein